MSKLSRGIRDKFVKSLNDEYEKNTWWRRIADDPQLFIGIRKNYLNVYFNGGSVLELRNVNGEFSGKSHFKYLVNLTRKNTKSPYVNFRNGAFDRVDLMDTFRNIGTDIEGIKKTVSTRDRQIEEKKGVHKLLILNKNVIDTEIQFPGDKTRRRIDFAALQRRDGEVKVVFFEAKVYSNTEIHLPLDRPAILNQVEAYRSLVLSRRAEIEESYRMVARNICAMEGWKRRRSDIFKEAEVNGLSVDPDVRIVIFGFNDQEKLAGNKSDGVFSRLKNELGDNCVLAKGLPKDLKREILFSD